MEHSAFRPLQLGAARLDAHADAIRQRLDSALRIIDEVAGTSVMRQPDQPITEDDVRALLSSRRERNRFFDGELFADPAWDILLELYAAKLGRLSCSTGDVCRAAAVPPTTALRWIALLEDKSLIERKADPMDRRRCYLSLSSSGFDAMASYFTTVYDGASRT